MADDKIVLMGDSINEFTPKNFTFFKKPLDSILTTHNRMVFVKKNKSDAAML